MSASFALELALKARLVLDSVDPPTTHSYPKLFQKLSPDAQTDVARRLPRGGRGASAHEFTELLKSFGNTFEDWRYLHENLGRLQPTTFHEGEIIASIHALHESILELRPDFRRWPGVIYDGES